MSTRETDYKKSNVDTFACVYSYEHSINNQRNYFQAYHNDCMCGVIINRNDNFRYCSMFEQ